MTDITKCQGKTCNRKHACYRHTAEDTPHWQSYFSEDPNTSPDECEMYWDNKNESKHDKLKEYDRYITEKRKCNNEKVSKLQKQLREGLQAECEKLTGHKFSDWIYKPIYNIFQEVLRTHHRVCALCWRKEYKKEVVDRSDDGLKWEICTTSIPKPTNI